MNNLQSGVTASDLSPQNFKNSSQEGAVQRTDNLSSSQSNQGGLPSINNLSADIQLKVVDGGQNQSILGLSSTQQTPTQESGFAPTSQVSSSSAPFIPIILVLVAVSIYFFRRYFEFATVEEETEDK